MRSRWRDIKRGHWILRLSVKNWGQIILSWPQIMNLFRVNIKKKNRRFRFLHRQMLLTLKKYKLSSHRITARTKLLVITLNGCLKNHTSKIKSLSLGTHSPRTRGFMMLYLSHSNNLSPILRARAMESW